ncbi:MAG: bile acid:sodium symporter [Verrucomicrobia bacterium]|nr:MAG: bile acid:sodium symporter [Verrucomicrobiota bacterium]
MQILLARLFPASVIFVSALAYQFPALFNGIVPHITSLLVVIMLSMAITVSVHDFCRVLAHPTPLFVGLGLHYLIMPLVAYLIATLLQMPPDLTAGMILVGCVASGTASVVMTYLAQGDVALSLTLSALSALVGVFITPLLTCLYLDVSREIAMDGMLIDINRWHWRHFSLQIVTLPIGIGLLTNHCFGRKIRNVQHWFSVISMIAILLVIAATMTLTSNAQKVTVPLLVVGVILHNIIGLLGGYWISRLLGFECGICRTLSIEVGMQNSGLAVALCKLYFTPLIAPVAALAGSLFSVWHNISGSLLANFWAHHHPAQNKRKLALTRRPDFTRIS